MAKHTTPMIAHFVLALEHKSLLLSGKAMKINRLTVTATTSQTVHVKKKLITGYANLDKETTLNK